MSDHIEKLKSFNKTKDFFIGIDSDGCVFDSMEIKHKECFAPNTINYWDLQAVSRFAREAAEFVNLYSQWRGCNRFPALLMVLDLLTEHPQAVDRDYQIPEVRPLRDWVANNTALSNATLEKEIEKTGDPILEKTMVWSKAVNEAVAKIVRNVPPFPHVHDCLERFRESADIAVVSGTPTDAIKREWQENDIAKYADMICGQELGSKKEHLRYAAAEKYDLAKILMLGDAPGDLAAAKANNVLFFPINPTDEAASWARLHDEAIDRFLDGTYAGSYEDELIAEFSALLPSEPPWKK